MLKTELVKKIGFRASWSEMGDKIIVIIPKNYHNDIKKMSKTVDVSIQDVEA